MTNTVPWKYPSRVGDHTSIRRDEATRSPTLSPVHAPKERHSQEGGDVTVHSHRATSTPEPNEAVHKLRSKQMNPFVVLKNGDERERVCAFRGTIRKECAGMKWRASRTALSPRTISTTAVWRRSSTRPHTCPKEEGGKGKVRPRRQCTLQPLHASKNRCRRRSIRTST